MKEVVSELRQDLVSGDWVVIATSRAKRPHDFIIRKRDAFSQPKDTCPFETLHGNARAVYSLRDSSASQNGGAPHSSGMPDDWWVQVVPNKYPALTAGACPTVERHGPYQTVAGIGVHEVVITRDHERALDAMAVPEAELALRAYQDRLIAITQDPCIRYVSIFYNHGPQAGATIAHPHSQIIATPVIPPDISRSIAGSGAYFQIHHECVHCVALAYERQARERVVYENEHAAVLAPFASKTAFELRVLPLRHEAYFEAADAAVRHGVAEALIAALAKLSKGLDRPDYNFFLHTAPVAEENRFAHYHWHIEIIPKTAVWAGFEIGTGIEISVITPESAAAFLRNISV